MRVGVLNGIHFISGSNTTVTIMFSDRDCL